MSAPVTVAANGETPRKPTDTNYMSRNKQSGVIQPLLTDMYQITMAYAYYKAGKRDDHAVFDLFFRKNPFQGEFTIFAGLDECLKFLENFRYSESDIEYLKKALPDTVQDDFYDFLATLNADDITVYAMEEGSICFPRIPIMRLEGPLPVVQLLETTLLTLVNYASLVTTNAARYRIASGPDVQLLEFGLRRAQGPDGGLSASKYCYMGGFDGTSNVLAGKLFDIPVKGTHAHAFVSSFSSFEELTNKTLRSKLSGQEENFASVCLQWRDKIAAQLACLPEEANDGELAAFITYAIAFPDGFLSLIDTYDVLRSGLLNFCAVALGLNELGYKAIGVRLDSGDLAYLSKKAREVFVAVGEKYNLPWFGKLTIVASNDINEETILSLNEQGHKINCFGIGTHLVTCQKQPALGCVYKLVEVNDQPRIKLSQDVGKINIPGKKNAYRLYAKDGHPLIDLMQKDDEVAPVPGQRVLCRHPFQESKRAYVTPDKVEPLYKCYWKNGQLTEKFDTLRDLRTRSIRYMQCLREDHRRNLNPTPYKVAVSEKLYDFIHDLWLQNAPIGELN